MSLRRMTRRQVLQGALAVGGLAAVGGFALGCEPLPPGSRTDSSKPEGTDLLPAIEHIIIYMQENHSYDNYFGQLSRGDGFTRDSSGQPLNTNPNLSGTPVPVFHETSTCDTHAGAGQTWDATHISWDNGAMDGFIRAANGGTGSMGYYNQGDLPFYYGLANTFPICDRWFGSVMGQTYPNRRYVVAGTSAGIVATDNNELLATPSAPNGLIFDRLNAHGITWTDYVDNGLVSVNLFPAFNAAGHVKHLTDFLADCANGTLPQVSIVDPNQLYWEEHPEDVQLGEAYSAKVINAVLSSPQWPETVLFFTWDEHGGYYDHVPPPPAIAPDNIPPRITVPPDQPGGFDRYGMRVPGFVISPFARDDYVSHVVHDHTSILKFIESKWNLGAMTYRDANADNLVDCFDVNALLGSETPPFLDPPTLPAPALTGSDVSSCQPSVPLP